MSFLVEEKFRPAQPLDLCRFALKVGVLRLGVCLNRLYYGDNLEVLRGFGDGQVDLIYLDRPFNSIAGYNVDDLIARLIREWAGSYGPKAESKL